MWQESAAPSSASGIAAPIKGMSLTTNLDQVDFLNTGTYYWTVIVVRTDSYERLTQPQVNLGRRIYVKSG